MISLAVAAIMIVLCWMAWNGTCLSRYSRGIFLGLAMNALMFYTCQVTIIISATLTAIVLFVSWGFTSYCFMFEIDPRPFLGLAPRAVPEAEKEFKSKIVRAVTAVGCFVNCVTWPLIAVKSILWLEDKGALCSGGSPWIFAIPIVWNLLCCVLLFF